MLTVEKFIAGADYVVFAKFSNGASGCTLLTTLGYIPSSEFVAAKLVDGVVTWPSGVQLDTELLYATVVLGMPITDGLEAAKKLMSSSEQVCVSLVLVRKGLDELATRDSDDIRFSIEKCLYTHLKDTYLGQGVEKTIVSVRKVETFRT